MTSLSLSAFVHSFSFTCLRFGEGLLALLDVVVNGRHGFSGVCPLLVVPDPNHLAGGLETVAPELIGDPVALLQTRLFGSVVGLVWVCRDEEAPIHPSWT